MKCTGKAQKKLTESTENHRNCTGEYRKGTWKHMKANGNHMESIYKHMGTYELMESTWEHGKHLNTWKAYEHVGSYRTHKACGKNIPGLHHYQGKGQTNYLVLGQLQTYDLVRCLDPMESTFGRV